MSHETCPWIEHMVAIKLTMKQQQKLLQWTWTSSSTNIIKNPVKLCKLLQVDWFFIIIRAPSWSKKISIFLKIFFFYFIEYYELWLWWITLARELLSDLLYNLSNHLNHQLHSSGCYFKTIICALGKKWSAKSFT